MEGPIFGLLCSVSVFFFYKETSPIPHPSGATSASGRLSELRTSILPICSKLDSINSFF